MFQLLSFALIVTLLTCAPCVRQALTDQQQFGKADEMYDKCIELEPDNATTYVHKGSGFLFSP